MKHFNIINEPKSKPPIFQLRAGPLWITRHGDKLTVWWGSKLQVFHGNFMVPRARV
jgi:hypothetical protein